MKLFKRVEKRKSDFSRAKVCDDCGHAVQDRGEPAQFVLDMRGMTSKQKPICGNCGSDKGLTKAVGRFIVEDTYWGIWPRRHCDIGTIVGFEPRVIKAPVVDLSLVESDTDKSA